MPGRAEADEADADGVRRFGLGESLGVSASVESVIGSAAAVLEGGGVGAGAAAGLVSFAEPVRRFQRPATFERKPDSVFMVVGYLTTTLTSFFGTTTTLAMVPVAVISVTRGEARAAASMVA